MLRYVQEGGLGEYNIRRACEKVHNLEYKEGWKRLREMERWKSKGRG